MAATDKFFAEAEEHVKAGEKFMKTSFFKWKPDPDSAVHEYQRAATCYKNAKQLEKARETYCKIAELQMQGGSLFHAGKSLENAGMLCRDMADFNGCAHFCGRAGQLFHESGTPDSAQLCWERAAKILDQKLPEKAIEFHKRCSDVAEAEEKYRPAAEAIGKAARVYVRIQKYEEAIGCLRKEIDLNAQAESFGLLNKTVIYLVLVHLTQVDCVAANRVYNGALSYPTFNDSEEANAIAQLLVAYEEGDDESGNAVLKSPLFKYMENEFAKLARSLVVPGGGGGGAKEEDEDEYAGGLC